MQLIREFFTIFEVSENQRPSRIPLRLWDVSHQHCRCFSSLPQIVPQRVESFRNDYRACDAGSREHAQATAGDIISFRVMHVAHSRAPGAVELVESLPNNAQEDAEEAGSVSMLETAVARCGRGRAETLKALSAVA